MSSGTTSASDEGGPSGRNHPFTFHTPVMADRVVELLVGDSEAIYVDATVGGGGHSERIFEALGGSGRLVALDRDPEAVAFARKRLPPAVLIIQERFSRIEEVVRPHAPHGVAGVMFDLGVSSHQLDSDRGFSFRMSASLDLRMDPAGGQSADELLNRVSREELIALIRRFGEDPQAPRIARAIIAERNRRGIHTTDHLAKVIAASVPAGGTKSLARVFQALRIAVNQELEELERGLEGAWRLMKDGSRLVVLSYHSLEDRIVKRFMKSKCEPLSESRRLVPSPHVPIEGQLLTRKPETPDAAEVRANPRARSAKLRAIRKLVPQITP